MMGAQRKYDSMVARIAGNIAAGMVTPIGPRMDEVDRVRVVKQSVQLARMIVSYVERTEPKPETPATDPPAAVGDAEALSAAKIAEWARLVRPRRRE